jgi:putative ABC transport system permease protein
VRTLTASPFIFTSLEASRKYDKRYGSDDITYVLVKCSPGYSPDSVKKQLQHEIPHVEILTRREFAVRSMQYWLMETGLGITVVITAILGLSVSAVVTSQTLFTVTQEYLRNYSTLSAVGFSRGQLFHCVFTQGLVLVFGGITIGSTLFLAAALASAKTPIPLEMLPEVYWGLVAVALFGGLCGAFLSIRSIWRIDPAGVFRG